MLRFFTNFRGMLCIFLVLFLIPQSIGAQESEPSKPLTNVEELGPFPEIYYTDAVLPAQVVKTRNAIVSAARSGDIEKLRPLIDKNKVKIVVSFETTEKDPIAYWKEISTDGTGRSILAEMLKVFSAGFVHVDAGTASDLYIWPYHFMYPLSQLTPEQEVELYLLVPAEYRKDMEDAGGYIGFRGGIDPEGTLHFFVSGE